MSTTKLQPHFAESLPLMRSEPRGNSLAELAEAAEERVGAESVLLFEGVETTSAELGAMGRRFATGLAGLGVGRGDRVAVCMANCPEVLATYHATWRLGGAVTPLLFLLSEHELHFALTDSGTRAIVTTPEFLPKVQAAADGLNLRIVVAGGQAPGVTSFDDLASGAEAALTRVDPTDLAALLYTGGTTGRSKGVMLSHDAVSSAAWAAALAGVGDSYDVSLLPLPLAHAYGMLVAAMAMHAVRPSRTVLMRWFDPAGWLQLAQDEHVQIGAVVPTMLRLLTTLPMEDYDLSALRRLVSGSAPLPEQLLADWSRRVPNVAVVEGYGCSEIAALGSGTPSGWSRPGSVGIAGPGIDIRIERLNGSTADTDEDGEVCILSPGLMTGYWNDPETTAHAVRDGWFHTGDIGHLDAEGYLFIVDRMKDIIIRGGFNVYPRDVEEALATHPEVAVSAVIGRPDDAHGEEVVAFVQLDPGASVTEADLVAFGREHLSAVKYPREVHIVDTIPLTSIGKLDRKALRALI